MSKHSDAIAANETRARDTSKTLIERDAAFDELARQRKWKNVLAAAIKVLSDPTLLTTVSPVDHSRTSYYDGKGVFALLRYAAGAGDITARPALLNLVRDARFPATFRFNAMMALGEGCPASLWLELANDITVPPALRTTSFFELSPGAVSTTNWCAPEGRKASALLELPIDERSLHTPEFVSLEDLSLIALRIAAFVYEDPAWRAALLKFAGRYPLESLLAHRNSQADGGAFFKTPEGKEWLRDELDRTDRRSAILSMVQLLNLGEPLVSESYRRRAEILLAPEQTPADPRLFEFARDVFLVAKGDARCATLMVGRAIREHGCAANNQMMDFLQHARGLGVWNIRADLRALADDESALKKRRDQADSLIGKY